MMTAHKLLTTYPLMATDGTIHHIHSMVFLLHKYSYNECRLSCEESLKTIPSTARETVIETLASQITTK